MPASLIRSLLYILLGMLLASAAFEVREFSQRVTTIEAKLDYLLGYISAGVHQ